VRKFDAGLIAKLKGADAAPDNILERSAFVPGAAGVMQPVSDQDDQQKCACIKIRKLMELGAE